jgi:hypothetical protein
MTDQTRRDVLIGSAAIGGAISIGASTRMASAQRTESIAKSEWDYRTLKELVEALRARKVSASELTEHTIARIETLDQRLNAVVVRDFDRARCSACRLQSRNRSISLGCLRPLAFHGSRSSFRKKTPSLSLVQRALARSFSARQMCRRDCLIGKALTTSTERPTILGTSAARPQARRAGPLRRSLPALGRCSLAPIAVDLCAYQEGRFHRKFLRYRARAILQWWVPWREALPTSYLRLTW